MNRLNEIGEAIYSAEEGLQSPTISQRDKESLRMLKTSIFGEPASDLSANQSVRWNLWTQRLNEESFAGSLKFPSLSSKEKQKLNELELAIRLAPRKSVGVSGIASAILPGAGQAYSGSWQAAGLSFVINAVLFGAVLEFSQKGMPAAAIASGGIFSITYIGNIVSAAKSAELLNTTNRAPYESELKAVLLPELTF